MIKVNLGRSLKDRRVVAAYPDGDTGREAITHYKVTRDIRYVSVIECRLETGRTHQIRAHMKYISHPIFNDATYGGDRILKGTVFSKYKSFVENCFKILPRQALHAGVLGFKHPSGNKEMRFESPLPDDITGVIEKWENYINYN
jgi:23S rRNA pseudouridine1911/1915/1917 synthase